MKLNVFEGARRVTITIQIIWVTICILDAYNDKVYISTAYKTVWPTAPFIKMSEDEVCEQIDAGENIIQYELEEGKDVTVSLCFMAWNFNNQEKNPQYLIPYKNNDHDDYIFGNLPSDSAVRKYTKLRTSYFQVPSEDKIKLEKEWNKERRDNFLGYVFYALIGIVAIELIKRLTGWIVRGFIREDKIYSDAE